MRIGGDFDDDDIGVAPPPPIRRMSHLPDHGSSSSSSVHNQADQLTQAARCGDVTRLVPLAKFIHVFMHGQAPLHVLASEGCSNGVRLLICNGADIAQTTAPAQDLSAPGCFGESALHLAVRNGHRATCAVLITAGAPLEQFDDLGLLPLHVAALTEERMPPFSVGSTIAEQLVHAGADPWARTFNRDLKRAYELADTDYSPGRDVGFDYQVYAEGLEEVPGSSPLDTRQTDLNMFHYLRDVITPGTAAFREAHAAEVERMPPGDVEVFIEANARRKSSVSIEKELEGLLPPARIGIGIDMHNASNCQRCALWPIEYSLFGMYVAGPRFSGVVDVGHPSPIEIMAVSARGREEDNRRFRHLGGKMSARIWDLEQELAASKSQLGASCDEVDRLKAENSSLRERLCEYDMFFDDSQEVSRPSPDNSSSCEDESTAEDSPPPTAAKNSGKAKKAEQARRATEKVSRGEVLTRVGIGALTKAEARAFLSAIPKNAAAAGGGGGQRKPQ